MTAEATRKEKNQKISAKAKAAGMTRKDWRGRMPARVQKGGGGKAAA